MGTDIKNWKLIDSGVNVIDAVNAITSKTYGYKEGTYAIRSTVTGRFITEFNESNQKLTIPEIEGYWAVLAPDDEKEQMRTKIADLVKNSNWSGISHNKIDNLTISKLWETVSEKISNDEKLMYKTMKMFFENRLYMNKQN